MPYVGSTFRIPLKDGFSSNPDFDLLAPTTLVEAKNVNLHNGGIQPRGGCEVVNIDNIVPYYSEDLGTIWQPIEATESNAWQSVTYGNGVFIAVARTGTNRIMRSTDYGLTWNPIMATEQSNWYSIAYGNGVFIAVNSNGTNRIMRSIDYGLTWQAILAPQNSTWYSIAYGNGVWIIVANGGTANILRSTDDGITWNIVAAKNSTWYSIAYGNGVFIAVSYNININNGIMRSTDYGLTWSNIAVPEANNWYSVIYGNGIWVSVTYEGTYKVMKSVDDGITWTGVIAIEENNWVSVTYGNGLFIAISMAGTNRIMYSLTNGDTWISVLAPTLNTGWSSISYGDGVFVAVGLSSTGWKTKDRIMKTPTPLINVQGITQHIPESGNIIGTYCIDESDNFLVDELGGRLIDESSYIIICTSDGNIWKNYIILLKSGMTLNIKYSFEQFYGKTYIANGEDVPQVYESQYAYTYDFGTPPKCTAALAGAGAGNVNTGTHSYKITFLSTGDKESTVGLASNEVITTAGDGKVNLTFIAISPNSSCTKRKIYRTKAGGTTYYFLHEIGDNTTTTYQDDATDASISVVVPTTNEAFVPTDWQTGWPKYFFNHGRGNQQRLYAFGVDGYPNRLYASVNQEADFGDAVVTVIDLLGNRITGATEFGENLLLFSDNKSYILNDSDATVSNWGINAATWEGGAAHQDMIVNTPTDVIVVSPEFNIFSIATTQKYGDMEIGSISKPVYLQKFAEDYLDLQQISKFYTRYDKNIRAVKIFVVLKGETAPTACLVYFVDKTPETGWVEHTFDFNNHCSALIQVSENEWKIYTGGDNGKVYMLESETLRDDGQIYNWNIATTPLILDNPRNEKQFDKVWIVMKPKGTESLAVDIDIDNRALATQYLIMTAPSTNLQNYFAFVGATGQREEVKISGSDGKDSFLGSLLIDFKDLKSV
jgi:photosystem II stability/assembly factor-like uncharacterized protein